MAPARERKPVQRLLVGRVMICEYLQVSNNGFKEFLKLGLPVRVINRTYYAHAENIDIFMRQITAQTLKDVKKPQSKLAQRKERRDEPTR